MKGKKLMIIILLIVLIVIVFLVKDNLLNLLYPKTYQEVVSTYAEKYNVEENLIFALIKAESNFDKDAISNRKAIGLMQLMEDTAREVANKNDIDMKFDKPIEELRQVDKNIEIGTCYLSTLMEKYQNKEVALAAYNAGIGTVNGWIEKEIIKEDGSDIENIPYKETNNYVRKILRDYKIYEYLYDNKSNLTKVF